MAKSRIQKIIDESIKSDIALDCFGFTPVYFIESTCELRIGEHYEGIDINKDCFMREDDAVYTKEDIMFRNSKQDIIENIEEVLRKGYARVFVFCDKERKRSTKGIFEYSAYNDTYKFLSDVYRYARKSNLRNTHFRSRGTRIDF